MAFAQKHYAPSICREAVNRLFPGAAVLKLASLYSLDKAGRVIGGSLYRPTTDNPVVPSFIVNNNALINSFYVARHLLPPGEEEENTPSMPQIHIATFTEHANLHYEDQQLYVNCRYTVPSAEGTVYMVCNYHTLNGTQNVLLLVGPRWGRPTTDLPSSIGEIVDYRQGVTPLKKDDSSKKGKKNSPRSTQIPMPEAENPHELCPSHPSPAEKED